MREVKLRSNYLFQHTFTYDTIPNEGNMYSQSTGVFDKNGVEIYEGDLLIDRYTDPDTGEDSSSYYPVVYSTETACYCVDNSYKKDGSSLVPMIEFIGYENLEVAGNIFQNNK